MNKDCSPKKLMHLKILAIVLSAACVLGCKDSASTKKPSLTNDELLQLMEGELFEVKVPDSIKSDQFAGLAIRHSNGTIDTFSSSNGWVPGETVKVVCFSPKKNVFRYAYFRESGSGSGSTSNFPITQQVSGDLGVRLHAAFVRSRNNGNRMTIILGSDAPTLPAGHILQALDRLAQGARAVASPAEDGGFILIGLSEPLEALFTDIPWGGERVLETVTIRAKHAGIELELIEPWYDVDDIVGLRKLRGELQHPSIARQAPQTSIFLGQLPFPLD